ncbi:uncharacterized protein LOC129969686 [Argiope bruennichi]|uniref:uncharacterized protein LOC129969686 n=1 Tax=Argiope bruennichi TaxID=94029 RepID=UPI0024947DD9|nr:uncharacterized protein LOC129969686 [Argiope bruennichi]
MRLLLFLVLLFFLAGGLSCFRLAIRVCFRDTATNTESECAFCNPRTLQVTMRNCTGTQDGIPNNLWTEVQKRCILRTCRQQHPSQKVLPTIFPVGTNRMVREEE